MNKSRDANQIGSVHSSSFSPKTCLVIGAGPAGTASSLLLARQGWKVCLVDRHVQIEQKICGECLSPPSREILTQLGALSKIPKEQIQELNGITLIGPLGSRCWLDFGGDPPFTIPRPVLDQTLLELARSEGVQVEMGVTIVELSRQGEGFVARSREGKLYPADFLIGADGRHSWVARQLGLASSKKHRLQHAAVMGHFSQPQMPLQGVEMHTASWGYVGLNPLPSGGVNAIAVMPPALLKERLSGQGLDGLSAFLGEHLLGRYAPTSLRERLAGSQSLSFKTWTASPLAWRPERVVGNRCALIGDSAGFIDPFTGEGLYHALASADELSIQIIQNGLEGGLIKYEKWHKNKFGPEERFCFWMQKLLPFSHVSDYVVRQLGGKHHLNRILAEAIADRIPTSRVLSPLFWGKVLWPTSQERT